MDTAQKVYELVKAMPEAQAVEVLDFAEFLRQKVKTKPSQKRQLAPLPVLEGYIPVGWKAAILHRTVPLLITNIAIFGCWEYNGNR